MDIGEKIKKSLGELLNQSIILPTKPTKTDEYKDIPYNLGEISSSTLGAYLSVWTKIVNWSGYNLAAAKVIAENCKNNTNRLKAIKYELYRIDSKISKLSIRDIENLVTKDEEVIESEDNLMECSIKVNMLSSIHDANLRNVNLISREITRRSGESNFIEGGGGMRGEPREAAGVYEKF